MKKSLSITAVALAIFAFAPAFASDSTNTAPHKTELKASGPCSTPASKLKKECAKASDASSSSH